MCTPARGSAYEFLSALFDIFSHFNRSLIHWLMLNDFCYIVLVSDLGECFALIGGCHFHTCPNLVYFSYIVWLCALSFLGQAWIAVSCPWGLILAINDYNLSFLSVESFGRYIMRWMPGHHTQRGLYATRYFHFIAYPSWRSRLLLRGFLRCW